MANPTHTLIASQTASGSTSTITFSSIPSTYTDVKLIANIRDANTTVGDNLIIRFNSDSTTNYSYVSISSSGATASSATTTNATNLISKIKTAIDIANTFSYFEMYISNYNSTSTKPIFIVDAWDNLDIWASQWRGTSGITSITLTNSSASNFVANSTFYLYGIKNS